MTLPVARTVPAQPTPHVLPPPSAPTLLWPRLAELLRDQESAASLGTLAGLVRPAVLDKPFTVGSASGSVLPTFTAAADTPGREEIGLLGPVTVRLSLQRLVTITVQTDAGRLVYEQNAVGGLKKVAGWAPFDTAAQVVVTNPSSSFYVCGWVYAPVWFAKRVWFDALQQELRALLPQPSAEASGVV